MEKCFICGEPATLHFTGNPNLPLCPLASCETALIDEINNELYEAGKADKETE